MASLEKAGQVIEAEGLAEPLFMLDGDGNRHAEPVYNIYPSATVLHFRQEFVRDGGGEAYSS